MRRQPVRWAFAILSAALILWLLQSPSSQKDHSAASHTQILPAWQAEKVDQWQLSPDGRQTRLYAKRAVHFDENSKTLLSNPSGLILSLDATHTLKAEQALVTPSRLVLEGNARITRKRREATAALILESGHLVYERTKALLSADGPVRITQGPNWMEGVGMHWWIERQRLILQRKVVSEFAPPAS